MRHAISLILISILVVACAATHKQRAVQYVVASDAVADMIADGWEPYVDIEIARCRETLPGTDLDTPDGRKECLGLAGEGKALEAALHALVASQQAVEVAINCESNPLKVPKEFLHKCVEPVDWQALGQGVLDAWNDIRPYYEAMQKAK